MQRHFEIPIEGGGGTGSESNKYKKKLNIVPCNNYCYITEIFKIYTKNVHYMHGHQ